MGACHEDNVRGVPDGLSDDGGVEPVCDHAYGCVCLPLAQKRLLQH